MRIASLFTVALATLALAACGPDPSDGDDISLEPDAETGTDPDANTTVTNMSTELGKFCTGVAGECPADAPNCITFQTGTPTNGFCTLGCGTSTAADMPPANGNALCAAQYDGTSGTPACAAHDGGMAGTFTWSCAVACGNSMGTELGTCPNNLVCTNNFCT